MADTGGSLLGVWLLSPLSLSCIPSASAHSMFCFGSRDACQLVAEWISIGMMSLMIEKFVDTNAHLKAPDSTCCYRLLLLHLTPPPPAVCLQLPSPPQQAAAPQAVTPARETVQTQSQTSWVSPLAPLSGVAFKQTRKSKCFCSIVASLLLL